MIRVLWLAKGLGPGGMERLLETHARVGDRSIFEFEAAYLVERPHSIVGSLEELGVPVHRLEGGLASWPRQLRRLVAEQRIDVVHTHSPMVAALAGALTAYGLEVQTGVFGADMAVHLVNDGPVTILVDTATADRGTQAPGQQG